MLKDTDILANLHRILQDVFGWKNVGYSTFILRTGLKVYDNILIEAQNSLQIDDEIAFEKEYETMMKEENKEEMSENDFDEDHIQLRDILSFSPYQKKMSYQFDFGGKCIHEIILEKIIQIDPNRKYPVCIGGAAGGTT